MTTRRLLLLMPLAAAVARPGIAAELPAPESLAEALVEALRAGRPLIVMASLHGCPFCRVVRDHYLAPLRADTGQPVAQRPGTGRVQLHDRQLRTWGVKVLPTVLFFGKGGREAAERLVGASIPDFYGAYLEERLRTATKSIG